MERRRSGGGGVEGVGVEEQQGVGGGEIEMGTVCKF